MERATLGSLSRLCRTFAGLALLAAAASGPAHAQEESSACKLISIAELEAAVGGKASEGPSGSRQTVPGLTLDECSVVLSGAGSTHPVSIRVVSNPGMDGAQAIKIRNAGQARESQWKTSGARLEQSTVGAAICILAGRPDVASHTVCSIPQGEGYVEVDVIGDVADLPSMAAVAALVQKAVSRL